MKHLMIYFLTLITLSSCDRIFQFGGEQELDGFDNQLNEPRLVIEAYINDLDTIQTVRLSETLPLKSDDPVDFVEDATVRVITDENTYNYQYIDSLNSYTAKFSGAPDVNYQLEVNYQSKTYRSSAVMADLQQFEIDSIEIRKAVYDFSHFRFFDPDAPFRSLSGQEILLTKDENFEVQDTLLGNKAIIHSVIYLNPSDNTYLTDYQYGDLAEFWFSAEPYIIDHAREGEVMNVYKIYLYAKESQIEQNYYRFDVKRFGRSWLQPGQIIVANDFAIGENISGIEFPGFFVTGDKVEFSMYGISLEAYNFYTSLQNTIQNDGGGFSPPPGNPVTNIFDEEGNPALGFFEVARVARVTEIVQGD
ncbi:MAG: DUF4249 family protein [Cyclobacteriaceae bacterium]